MITYFDILPNDLMIYFKKYLKKHDFVNLIYGTKRYNLFEIIKHEIIEAYNIMKINENKYICLYCEEKYTKEHDFLGCDLCDKVICPDCNGLITLTRFYGCTENYYDRYSAFSLCPDCEDTAIFCIQDENTLRSYNCNH